MTFILTEISELDGIIMASDSSEIQHDGSTKEVNKTLFFNKLNIGISTWGYAEIAGKDINDWLTENVGAYMSTLGEGNHTNEHLDDLARFLRRKLYDYHKNLSGKKKKEFVCGLHIAGYIRKGDVLLPAVDHVHNDNGDNTFVAQIPAINITERGKGQTSHLRNGIYEEFALFWHALYGLNTTFINTIIKNPKYGEAEGYDNVKLRAEVVGNWVKFMANSFKEAGRSRLIGKKINILVIQPEYHRKFIIPEMQEQN